MAKQTAKSKAKKSESKSKAKLAIKKAVKKTARKTVAQVKRQPVAKPAKKMVTVKASALKASASKAMSSGAKIAKEKLLAMYREMLTIRRFEEKAGQLYGMGLIGGFCHLYIGQEAVVIGMQHAAKKGDAVITTYRDHGHMIACGMDLKGIMAELTGRIGGFSKGKGGSMHLVDVANGIMGASAVVGTTIANSIGYAYGVKLKKQNNIVVCFFGDGATDEGVFYESMDFATLKVLPIIFVCEKNGYAIHTAQAKRQSVPDIAAKAAVFGMPVERLGDDVLHLYERISAAVETLRSGGTGPFFFECETYRWKEHVGPSEDYNAGYRARTEAEPWMQQDQVQKFAMMLDPQQRQQIEQAVEIEIAEAFEFAENSPFPPDTELYDGVFA